MGLSAKNGWYDEQGRVYIFYTPSKIQEDMDCGHEKAVKLLAELDTKGIGLSNVSSRGGDTRPESMSSVSLHGRYRPNPLRRKKFQDLRILDAS